MSQSDRYRPAFCQAIDRAELNQDPHSATAVDRATNRSECIRLMEDHFATQPREYWMEQLSQEGLIFAL